MAYPTYESLKNKQPGNMLDFDNNKYLFLCRQELPGGDFCLLESFIGANPKLILVRENGEVRALRKSVSEPFDAKKDTNFNASAILDEGDDISAEKLNTKPLHMPKVDGALPEFDEFAYIPLGHPAVDLTVSVDRMGNIWDQSRYYDRTNFPGEKIIYDPRKSAGSVAGQIPYQTFLDGIYPILINVHRTSTELLENTYLMETGDLRQVPAVWIRSVHISLPDKKVTGIEYTNVGAEACNATTWEREVPEERFYDCLVGLILTCDDFLSDGAQISIPDKRLERSYYGTQISVANLFNGPQAHYGNRFYGLTGHNFFPPNYITAILAYTQSNQLNRAGMLANYLLTYAVDSLGRILYRQGINQNYGFSASELGQLLWVISRYHRAAGDDSLIKGSFKRILAMGNYICSKITPCESVPETYLVRTCAEADTNERIADYLQNTAWSICGLEACVNMLKPTGCDVSSLVNNACMLKKSFDTIVEKCVVNTPLGELVPFCLQYRVLPWTMSGCRKTTVPVEAEALEKYLTEPSSRSTTYDPTKQNFMENRYSNYRYYPELLSSCLLTPDKEEPILKLREEYGGELLGMIRFNRWLDDWPAYNLAIYYMERGQIDKYLLLLAAHARYHGLIDFHTYYEQVGFRNGHTYVKADTSTPSILLNNIMLNMMFCYETVNSERVELLKGVPADWFEGKGFTVKDIRSSFGTVSIRASRDTVTVTRKGKFPETRIYLNAGEFDAELPNGVTRGDGYLLVEPSVKSFKLKYHR